VELKNDNRDTNHNQGHLSKWKYAYIGVGILLVAIILVAIFWEKLFKLETGETKDN
jgi:hypothetical protein